MKQDLTITVELDTEQMDFLISCLQELRERIEILENDINTIINISTKE